MYKYHLIRKLIETKRLEKKSTTIQMMATSMGMSTKSLENYRDGKSEPSVDKAENIAKYFGKDMNFFFDIENWNSIEITPTVSYEPEVPYFNDVKDKLIQQLEEQISQLKNQVEEQSIMLNAFRNGSIKVVENSGNAMDGKCG